MRKTQVALAAVALLASTAALADVKISGQFDVGVFHTGKDSAGKGGTFMEQGALLDHSGFTLDVNEDLGNGLKAFAVLENGFSANGAVDNGGNAGNTGALFNRQSFIGLSSDVAGTVGLGKQLSPFILSQALTNFAVGSFWVNRLAVGNGGGGFAQGGNGINAVGFFQDNAITYTSPTIAGFTARLMTTTATGTQGNVMDLNNPTAASGTTAATTNNRYDSFMVSGNVGPAFLSAAWQERKDAYKSWTVGATGSVMDGLSVMANYMNDNPTGAGATVKSWAVGAKYSLLAGTDAILQYAQNDANTNKAKLVNLTLTQSLSKRTTAYAMYGHGSNVGSAIGNFGNATTANGVTTSNFAGLNNNTYGVGIAHSF